MYIWNWVGCSGNATQCDLSVVYLWSIVLGDNLYNPVYITVNLPVLCNALSNYYWYSPILCMLSSLCPPISIHHAWVQSKSFYSFLFQSLHHSAFHYWCWLSQWSVLCSSPVPDTSSLSLFQWGCIYYLQKQKYWIFMAMESTK